MRFLSEDYEEIAHVFIVSEDLGDVQETKQFYYDYFLNQIEKKEGVGVEEADSAEETFPETENVDVEKEIAKAEAEVRDALIAGGIDPDWEIPEPTEGGTARKKPDF